MLVGICSDLHLEFGEVVVEFPEEQLDLLLLAGDITLNSNFNSYVSFENSAIKKRSLDFFKLCGIKAKTTIMVLGNHEHYDFLFEDTANAIRLMIKESGANVILLDNETFELGEFSIFGATLWTDLNKKSPIAILDATHYMTDYSVIRKVNGNRLVPEDTIDENTYSRICIQKFLSDNDNAGKRSIIITHHTPTWLGVSEDFKSRLVTYAYANTGLEEMILESSSLELWVSGHQHTSHNYMLGNCTFIGNPKGYENQNKNWKLKVLNL